MIDVTQPIILHQEPPSHTDALLRAYGGRLEYQAIDQILHWVLFLPPTCRATEHIRYRSIIQYQIYLSGTATLRLCANTNAETGEEFHALVIPWESG